MSKATGLYPSLTVDTTATGVVSHAGAVLLVDTVAAVGLDRALSTALAPWRGPNAIHDPGKIVCDLAVALAIGGDCLADIAMLRAEPGVFGPVASDPTVSRLISTLAADSIKALAAIDAARAAVRARVWKLAGEQAPDHGIDADRPLIVDLDATLVTAHSEKEKAAPTFKRGYGFHPLCSFVDHGGEGTGGTAGDPAAAGQRRVQHRRRPHCGGPAGVAAVARHRPGRAGRARGADPRRRRRRHSRVPGLAGRAAAVLLGGVHPARGRRGADREDSAAGLESRLRRRPRTPGRGLGGRGHRAAGAVRLASGDAGHRAQGTTAPRRPTPLHRPRRAPADRLGHQHPRGQLADLELRHRRRARAEDRIRTSKDTGLTNLPLHDFTQNQVWVAIVALATELTAWMQLLALTDHPARRWEPKRLRLRLFAIAGRIARHARRVHLRLATHAPWAHLITLARDRLHRLPQPA